MGRTPEKIVDEQVRQWTYERSQIHRHTGRRRYWPLITISREFGAGGALLAEILSKRIGFTVWDKELVQAIAEASGGDEAIVQTLDERRRRAIDEALHALVVGARHTNVKYHKTLVRVVQAVAARGGSIIVGRGANYLTKPDERLCVRIVAPLANRVKRWAEEQGIDTISARKAVQECDSDRVDFIRTHFHRDVRDASDYDMVLNGGSFSLEAIAELVLAGYKERFGHRPPEIQQSQNTAKQRHAATEY